MCLNNSNNESSYSMKGKVLISIIALIAALWFVLYYIGVAVAVVVLLLIFAGFLVSARPKNTNLIPDQVSENIQTVTDTYGTPDDIIIVNPTRGNELDGVVLVYDEKGFLYYNGILLNKNEITDVSFFNAANPYMANDYQVVIKTTSERYPSVYISAGNELGWAKDLSTQIKSHLNF